MHLESGLSRFCDFGAFGIWRLQKKSYKSARHHPTPMLHELAQHLRANHDAVIERWMEAVRADENIAAADRLDRRQLRDHLDVMLQKLAQQLGSPAAENAPAAQPEPEAIKHGSIRWQQHYRVDELVREISVLRACFLELFSDYLRERRQIETDEFLRVTRIVHNFFDEICTESVAAYVREREEQAERTAEALRLMNKALEESNRQYEDTESLRRRTLRAVAHDMATPVNALGLGVTYLSESEDPAEREDARRLVSRTLAHLRGMLDQLLEFGRTDGGYERPMMGELQVPALADYLVTTFSPIAAAKGLEFSAEIDPALTVIESDENKVQRIAVNLLTNAIKYCDHGSVKLAMRAVSETEWSMEVADTGCGIPPEETERVFKEFQRLAAHAEQPGLGLGLSIVRTLAERLGGSVRVESEVGRGSKFSVVLPRKG
jgi:signal transduction histidine kinase